MLFGYPGTVVDAGVSASSAEAGDLIVIAHGLAISFANHDDGRSASPASAAPGNAAGGSHRTSAFEAITVIHVDWQSGVHAPTRRAYRCRGAPAT